MKIIYCFGDSNTWGYDAQSPFGERYPMDIIWTEIIKNRTGIDVINDGMNGRQIPESAMQTENAAKCVLRYADRQNEILLWIMLGTNDIINNPAKGAKYVASKMDSFLSMFMEYLASSKGPVHIRLISPPILKKGTWVDSDALVKESAALGNLMEEVAKKYRIDYTDAGKFNIPVLYDGAHFSEEGHSIFAEEMLKLIV